MLKKFKLSLIYVSLLSSIACSNIAYAAISDDPADNLKATIGNKNNNQKNMSVSEDGTIVFGGNKENKKEKEIVYSGDGQVKKPEAPKEEVEKTDIPTTPEGEFNGGLGKPFYSETGVLVFKGQSNNKRESVNKEQAPQPSINESNTYTAVPDIKLNKIPVNVRDMPIPSELPPLPSENGNVMLPVSLPTSQAVSLPPLPDFFIPNLGVSMGTIDQEGINNFGIPVSPDGKPINYKGASSVFVGEKNTALSDQFVDYMKTASNKFLNLGIPMRVVIVNTNDHELRRFVATNILRSNKNNFESIDTGLTSILSLDTQLNNNDVPICYIVLKNDQQNELMNKYIKPLKNFTNDETIASYLVAHQVAHCMDNLERYKQLPKVSTWFGEDAKKVGLSSAAIKRLYPYGMTYNQYSRTTMHLYDDLGQRQYQERIADIFALYLTVFAGYDEKIMEGIGKLRNGIIKNSSHNTYDAIKNIKSDYANANKRNVKTLWSEARRLQSEKDIDSSLQFGASENMYKASLNKDKDHSESSITEEVKNTKNKDLSIKTKEELQQQVNFGSSAKFGDNKNSGSKYFGTSENKTKIKE